MPTPQELEAKFWKALKSDMTLMLGLDGVDDGHARPMTAQEFKATGVVAVPIDSASAKVRTGFPADEPEDVDLPYWGGLIPMRTVLDDPEPDSHVPADKPVPGYLQDYVKRSRE